ncbi:hypothetical protein U27_04534 [Candidatus Vecturithrix granuli]|uniref:Glycosyl hydrolase-like 10 domain-containing protein n=1 Tax=Vecturithrix granuli TaxID=1499967 RepID=A0A081BZ12_VECG1|nr:hypothetical protein U27_04534 [Candidatus Vecturithrix granuli]
MHIHTQLFLGHQEQQEFSAHEVRQKILNAKKFANIQRLMIWTDDRPETYQPLVALCREHEIQPYLWFPVLADIPGYPSQEQMMVLNHEQQRGYGHLGRWEKLGAGEEQFLFLCPNTRPALADVFEIYKTLVGQVDFDGVFLDRVRYPSCANGFESLFTCFCDACQQRFAELYDEPLDEYIPGIRVLLDRLQQFNDHDLEQCMQLDDLWGCGDLDQFFVFRAHNITCAVKIFTEYAGLQGKQIGLDLFTPSLSPFVSQDYRLLSACCDWIKPMSYCHAIGPAGVPLEIACLLRALHSLCPKVSDSQRIAFCARILNVPLPETEELILQRGIPETFVAHELEKIRSFALPEKIEIYPGVEMVKHPHFDLNIDQQILEKYLAAIAGKVDGFVASWNLLYIPDEHWKLMEQ